MWSDTPDSRRIHLPIGCDVAYRPLHGTLMESVKRTVSCGAEWKARPSVPLIVRCIERSAYMPPGKEVKPGGKVVRRISSAYIIPQVEYDIL